MKRNRGKQQNGKDQRSLQESQDTKGIFHANTVTKKDSNSMDLTQTEDIKKSWQENTELYKKDFNDLDNHDGVITQTPWSVTSSGTQEASLQTKLAEVMEFQVSYFKS